MSWKAGLHTFYEDFSILLNHLDFGHCLEEIILGSERTCRTMNKNLKGRISKFMLELLKQIGYKTDFGSLTNP